LNAKQGLPHGSVWIGAIIDVVDDRWSTGELTRDNNFLIIPVTVR
jgi:hypothetical protein